MTATASSRRIVDYLRRLMSGGLSHVTMEYLPEARHNNGFRTRLIPVVQEFHAALDYRARADCRLAALRSSSMRPCALSAAWSRRGSVLHEDPTYIGTILSYWKDQLEQEIAENTEKA
jgi:hypothetical protein